jgi:hypothetical protein
MYESNGRANRQIPLASITDPANVAAVARAALEESTRRADVLDASDPGLSAIERAEGERLRQVFGSLLPGASNGQRPTATP